MTGARPRYLVLTGHDYASPRRSKMHFVIDELARRGDTCVFSPGFSALSSWRGGAHQVASNAVNTVQSLNGVSSYVWKSALHPFNPRRGWLHPASALAFDTYRRLAPAQLKSWAQAADVIIVESGLPVLFAGDLRRWNPAADLIYLASDDLETIGCDPALSRALASAAPGFSWACMPSALLAPLLPPGMDKYFVPQGVDTGIVERAGPSPFSAGTHAIAIGSMLFDPGFFEHAVDLFPDLTFHVIGSGMQADALPSQVEWYPVLPFEKLPAFMKHADIGIAPYRAAHGVEYLRDTSLKLIQYGLFGLPGVCPHFAAGAHRLRFGYEPGNRDSIGTAIAAALSCEDRAPEPALGWPEVTAQLLDPRGAGGVLVEAART